MSGYLRLAPFMETQDWMRGMISRERLGLAAKQIINWELGGAVHTCIATWRKYSSIEIMLPGLNSN